MRSRSFNLRTFGSYDEHSVVRRVYREATDGENASQTADLLAATVVPPLILKATISTAEAPHILYTAAKTKPVSGAGACYITVAMDKANF